MIVLSVFSDLQFLPLCIWHWATYLSFRAMHAEMHEQLPASFATTIGCIERTVIVEIVLEVQGVYLQHGRRF